MNLSRKWLNEFVGGVSVEDISDRDFSEAMTLSGSKVEVFEELCGELKNIVTGKILSIEKHPNSDHMLVCSIDVGEAEPIQICTGAWNVHVGDFIPVAKHDSYIAGGNHILRGELRGVPSEGMLCSLKELGLDTHNFPYGVISAAALLNDYHPIDPAKPSIPADIKSGDKLFGSVIAAEVTAVETVGFEYKIALATANECVTVCQNLHAGDLAAFDTAKNSICTLEDLRAEQREFPHCIPDGIFIMHEDGMKVGEDIRTALGLDDHVVEFEITPNRADCLSMIGLAREAAVTFGKELKLHKPVVKGGAGDINELAGVQIDEPELCPRYTARMVKNVKIGPSPRWMRERIMAMGMRPINNLVDITNYVMMEYGQPMHAFDFSCVKGGKIVVRTARAGETLETLDGGERKLTEKMLCICDEDKPIGVAGVMGGANSEIVGDTAMVLFESANFNGTSIRRTAAALNMRTAASARFEKGLDPMMTVDAVNRACELVEILGCGEVCDGMIDVVAADLRPQTVPFDPAKVNWVLGTDIDEQTQRGILESLGFKLDGYTVEVPSWRRDIAKTYSHNDLAEEVARIYGFNNIPATLMDTASTTVGGYTEEQKSERSLGAVCRAAGYDEVITYSFYSPAFFDKIRLPGDSPLRDAIRILNPLGEDTSAMRTTTLPSILELLARNYNYRNKNVRLYEVGRTYFKKGRLADEQKVLTLGAYGDKFSFYSIKGAVEALLRELKIENVKYVAEKQNPSYHPGRCAKVYAGEALLGIFGQVHPLVCANYGVDCEMYCAELSFSALMAAKGAAAVYKPLPKFPAVTRDIAVVCDKSITVATLKECIMEAGSEYLEDCTLFDIYTGSHVAPGKKSVAFSLTMRAADQTLTDEHAEGTVSLVLKALEEKLGAIIR